MSHHIKYISTCHIVASSKSDHITSFPCKTIHKLWGPPLYYPGRVLVCLPNFGYCPLVLVIRIKHACSVTQIQPTKGFVVFEEVAILNFLVIHSDLEPIRSTPHKLCEPHNLLYWVLHHQVLPLEIEWCLKGVLVVNKFIQKVAVCLREYVFGVVRLSMLRNIACC